MEVHFDEFKSGGLHEVPDVATRNLGTISAFARIWSGRKRAGIFCRLAAVISSNSYEVSIPGPTWIASPWIYDGQKMKILLLNCMFHCGILFYHITPTSDTNCHALEWLLTGFGMDDWIYWHLIHTTLNYRKLQRYRWSTHFTVHIYTHTRVLSLY
jgi:hypothetical protein